MLWGWSLPECFAFSQILLHPPSYVLEMAPPFNGGQASHRIIHYHVCGEGIPWHPTSIAIGAQLNREELRLLTFYDLATTVCAMSSHHWPSNTSWEHSMSHNIYYMSHTIDKWNLYCSYTIKYIFVSIRIPRDLTAHKKKKKKKKFAPQRHFFSGMLTRTKNVNLFGLM